MSDWLRGLLSFVGGSVAGTLFFAGLWLTVRRLPSMRHPALILMSGYLVRLALTLGIIWWSSRGNLWQLVLCLAGFLAARWVIVRLTNAALERDDHAPQP